MKWLWFIESHFTQLLGYIYLCASWASKIQLILDTVYPDTLSKVKNNILLITVQKDGSFVRMLEYLHQTTVNYS